MKNITIIIPIHNSAQVLERCLASLISNKNFIYEVIIINDRSEDDYISIIKPFKQFFNITVYDNILNPGPGPARRIGILNSKSDWITFLDSDDCLTPNSLKYVEDYFNKDILLVFTQSIYYESGTFNKKSIDYCDNSCGGNFYNRKFLIENNLLPHINLFMSEDEYFNNIITHFIEYKKLDDFVRRYEYPVYEVHHDLSDRESFALSQNWNDYLIKYHLLKEMYVTDFFKDKKELKQFLIDKMSETFVMCYFMCIQLDEDYGYKIVDEYIEYFIEYVKYMKNIFLKDKIHFILYFSKAKNKEKIQSIFNGAKISTGNDYKPEPEMFLNFLDKLYIN